MALVQLQGWKAAKPHSFRIKILHQRNPSTEGSCETERIKQRRLCWKKLKIPLTHSLHTSSESTPELISCLIIDDRPKPNSQKLTFEFAEKKIKSENIPISRIIKLSKLKSDYRSFEAKVDLFNSFDIFLADRRIIHMLPKILGKVFYKKKKKIPVPLELRSNGNWKEEIDMGFCSSLLCLSNGTCSVVKVGKFEAMEVEEIVDNIMAASGSSLGCYGSIGENLCNWPANR